MSIADEIIRDMPNRGYTPLQKEACEVMWFKRDHERDDEIYVETVTVRNVDKPETGSVHIAVRAQDGVTATKEFPSLISATKIALAGAEVCSACVALHNKLSPVGADKGAENDIRIEALTDDDPLCGLRRALIDYGFVEDPLLSTVNAITLSRFVRWRQDKPAYHLLLEMITIRRADVRHDLEVVRRHDGSKHGVYVTYYLPSPALFPFPASHADLLVKLTKMLT